MRTILKNCTLLDGTKDMLIQNDMDIAFENGKITEIGKVNAKKGDICYDLNGKYVMPGLINLHVHLPAGGKPKNKPLKAEKLAKFALSNELIKSVVLKMCHAYAMQDLLSGVTTVRAGWTAHTCCRLCNLCTERSYGRFCIKSCFFG